MAKESRPKMPQSPSVQDAGGHFTRTWECQTCGFMAHGPTQPDLCPQCGSDRHEFHRA